MENINYAYAEVLNVLENMDQQYLDKIPKKLLHTFQEKADPNYQKHIFSNQDFMEEKLEEKTIHILALLNLKYWTNSEEHKENLISLYQENSIKKNNQHQLTKDDIKDIEESFKEKRQTAEKGIDIIEVKKESILSILFRKLRIKKSKGSKKQKNN